MSQEIKHLLPQDMYPTELSTIEWMKGACKGHCQLNGCQYNASFGKIEVSLHLWFIHETNFFYELRVNDVHLCPKDGFILYPKEVTYWTYPICELDTAIADFESVCKAVSLLVDQEGGSE